MSYSKAIVVQYRRNINIGVVDTTISNSHSLSDLDLGSINQIIGTLTEVISNPNGAFIWGSEQIVIDSDSINSKITDEINGVTLSNTSTISLLNLMVEIKNFKEQYQIPSNLKNIIGQAFETIKSNPHNYKRWPTSDTDFSTTIDNVYVSLVLTSDDLNLPKNEYLNQLKTNF
ncbi:hypothetical protein ASE21_19285 [Flavobacterium sp. Root901]|uniref:hypothetical protein n=1 Tax=Flavobacterium sp. Root901 TaxID=1736605 RepID=UPI00070F3691|nr:hypothetical protein [Flavobacterium sp. Root901]KRD06316.1 hypothetical protein ASE21_19285 [Flavobacterium sp. Root901]